MEHRHDQIKEPSEWVVCWVSRIPKQGRLLDVACGAGRHTRYLAQLGYRVEAVDIDLSKLGDGAAFANVNARQYDLENAVWPYARDEFDGIVVTNYLHRPLFAPLQDSLRPGGVLIYETFAQGNEKYGRPRNPDHLLRPGELLDAVRGRMRVVAYQDVSVERPAPALVQRICAVDTR
ncbi:MAG: class I SAM-dependent methyltransferase [Burkholderiales bacterium]